MWSNTELTLAQTAVVPSSCTFAPSPGLQYSSATLVNLWKSSAYFLIGGKLQCCVGFCYTTMQISHNYRYFSSLLSLPPLNPSHPSRSSQSTRLDSLCDIATSHQLSILHMIVYICQYRHEFSCHTPWVHSGSTSK